MLLKEKGYMHRILLSPINSFIQKFGSLLNSVPVLQMRPVHFLCLGIPQGLNSSI